ncbi:MAG: PilZ domain-containing protein, partial [Pseudomonadota bacterium]|nr:PilZ domain-containing protein [Pseudomonadota bacterium]
LMADLAIDGAKRIAQVRVRNLSAGGLMVEYPHPVEQGTLVEVDVRGIGPVDGRVAWFTAGRLGIAFDKPIDPRQARKPVSGAHTPPATSSTRGGR